MVEIPDVPTVTKILGMVGPQHVEALDFAVHVVGSSGRSVQHNNLEELQAVISVLSNINVARAST